jgi:F-type H+-transporting ATPase subunit delta
MKRVSLGAARRYARALLDVGLAKGIAEGTRDELREALSLLAQHKDLATSLAHPAIAVDKKKQVVAAVWKEGRSSEIMRRLLLLLVERGRFGLLPAIERSFAEQWNAHRRVASAQVVSAKPLDRDEREGLNAALQRATGMGIETRERVDPAVLGGVLVTIAGTTYDGTVRARLKALRERLAAGPGTALRER